ncbi:MAG: hypothetical protein GXY36_13270 [Chloroflexi bacterium]|nr:hypothetical protein [Chloroflexota bacterium]
MPNQNSSCLSSPRSAYTFEVEPFTTALQIVSAHHLAPLTSGVDGLCIHKPDSASINGYSNLCESWDLFEIVHRTDSSRHFPIQVWEFKYPPAGNWCVDTLNNTPISSSKSIFGTDLIHRNYDYADLTLDGLGSQHVQYGKEEVTVRVEPPDYLSQYGMLPQLELTRLNFPDVTSVRLRSVSPGEYRGEVYFPESDTHTLNLKVITAENSKEIPLPTPISTNVSVEPVTFTYDCSPSPDATCLLPGYGVTVEIETWIGGEMRTAASHHIIWEIELKVSGGEDAERLPAPTCDNARCSSTYQEQGDIEGRFDQREIIVSGTTDVQGTPQPIPAELKPRFTCTYARQPIVPFSADGSADNQILVTASNPSIRIGPSIAELDRECQDGKWLVNIDDGNELRLSGTLTSQDNTVLHEFNVDFIDERFTVELPAKLTSAPGSFQLQFDVYLGTAKIFVSDSLSVVIEDARSASE